jgi:hypothetical protein
MKGCVRGTSTERAMQGDDGRHGRGAVQRGCAHKHGVVAALLGVFCSSNDSDSTYCCQVQGCNRRDESRLCKYNGIKDERAMTRSREKEILRVTISAYRRRVLSCSWCCKLICLLLDRTSSLWRWLPRQKPSGAAHLVAQAFTRRST